MFVQAKSKSQCTSSAAIAEAAGDSGQPQDRSQAGNVNAPTAVSPGTRAACAATTAYRPPSKLCECRGMPAIAILRIAPGALQRTGDHRMANGYAGGAGQQAVQLLSTDSSRWCIVKSEGRGSPVVPIMRHCLRRGAVAAARPWCASIQHCAGSADAVLRNADEMRHAAAQKMDWSERACRELPWYKK